MTQLRPRAARLVASATLVAIAGAAVPVAAGAQEAPWEVVASGLDNPRHLSFAPGGELYVAEAGRGGQVSCSIHPALGEFCLGFSGAVTEVNDRGPDPRVVTQLPSIASEGETLGPSDVVFTSHRDFVVSIGLGGSDQFRAGFGPQGALLATLLSGRLGGGTSLFADVLANEFAANPDGTDIDSNPVGFTRHGNQFVLADAGGNAVVQVERRTAEFSTVAPFGPTPIGADAVPTAVERGRDGAYYVSQLTGVPFQPGAANIWRVMPGQAPTVFASGLTNVTDLEFARDGSLYAVEISSIGLLNGPIGSLKKITPGGNQHETIVGDLFAPYGVALAHRAAYVSTCSVCTGEGEVIRIPLD